MAIWAAAWAESKAKLLEVEAIVSLFQRWTSFLQDYWIKAEVKMKSLNNHFIGYSQVMEMFKAFESTADAKPIWITATAIFVAVGPNGFS